MVTLFDGEKVLPPRLMEPVIKVFAWEGITISTNNKMNKTKVVDFI